MSYASSVTKTTNQEAYVDDIIGDNINLSKYYKAYQKIYSLQNKIQAEIRKSLGVPDYMFDIRYVTRNLFKDIFDLSVQDQNARLKDTKIDLKDLSVEVVLNEEEFYKDKFYEDVYNIDASHNDKRKEIMILYPKSSKKYSDSIYENTGNKPVFFQLSYKEEVVYTFYQPIQWMLFFGDYLIFLNKKYIPYSESEDLNLSDPSSKLISSIDLKYVKESIGHSKIPVFKTTFLDWYDYNINIVEPYSMKVTDYSLRLEETYISKDVFDQGAFLMQDLFEKYVIVSQSNLKQAGIILNTSVDSKVDDSNDSILEIDQLQKLKTLIYHIEDFKERINKYSKAFNMISEELEDEKIPAQLMLRERDNIVNLVRDNHFQYIVEIAIEFSKFNKQQQAMNKVLHSIKDHLFSSSTKGCEEAFKKAPHVN